MAMLVGITGFVVAWAGLWFLALAPRRWGGVGKDHWGL